MHTTQSKEEFANYGSDEVDMMTIASSEVKDWIAEEVDRTYAEPTQAEVQN